MMCELLFSNVQCSILVDRMIHRSLSREGGEALSLLLKRSWNPVIGLQPPEKQVCYKVIS